MVKRQYSSSSVSALAVAFKLPAPLAVMQNNRRFKLILHDDRKAAYHTKALHWHSRSSSILELSSNSDSESGNVPIGVHTELRGSQLHNGPGSGIQVLLQPSLPLAVAGAAGLPPYKQIGAQGSPPPATPGPAYSGCALSRTPWPIFSDFPGPIMRLP